MYTIGYLIKTEAEKNVQLKYLTEKGWNLSTINIEEQLEQQSNLNAILVFGDRMPDTCSWLMTLKKQINVPIFLISESGDSHSTIVYLKLGAEVCFPIEIEPEELYYTVENILKRYSNHKNDLSSDGAESLEGEKLKLLARNLSVMIDGKIEISLTKKEYQALEILCATPDQTITYEEFKEQIWASEINRENKNYRVANLIFHLRNKIEANGISSRLIKTVRSKGYKLDLK